MLLRKKQRTGAIVVESALVYSILFVMIFAMFILGITVFRYHQVAHSAREGARYAVVHGARYSLETELPAATPEDVYTHGIKPYATGMSPPRLTYSVTWDTDNKQTSSKVVLDPATGKSTIVTRQNKVSVTVTYRWNTGLFGTIPVSSTCVMTMSY